ncbi:MAG: ribbon-helix-helix domain-containing protein [bacterium]|nr:ribbon-helix-helix domain-containing protein [bacterium]
MRRIQLYLDDDVDDALTAQAAKLGTTRSALVRDAVRASLGTDLHTVADPVDDLVGWLDVEPDDDIDAVIYGLDE